MWLGERVVNGLGIKAMIVDLDSFLVATHFGHKKIRICPGTDENTNNAQSNAMVNLVIEDFLISSRRADGGTMDAGTKSVNNEGIDIGRFREVDQRGSTSMVSKK